MTAIDERPPTFPEPRRAALRALLMEQTTARGVASLDALDALLATSPDPHPDGEQTDEHDRNGSVVAVQIAPVRPTRRRGRPVAVAAALVAAVMLLAGVLAVTRHADDASPARPTSPSPSTPHPAVASSAVEVPAVSPVAPGSPVAEGWTAGSCPYFPTLDVAGLIGVPAIGAVWSGTSTPVRCRVYDTSGDVLLDITTFSRDSEERAEATAQDTAAAGSDVQPVRALSPPAGPDNLVPPPTAAVHRFRTTSLTGDSAGAAAAVAAGSWVFLVRTSPALDQLALDQVVAVVVDTASAAGGSALTSQLRPCAQLVGSDYGAAMIGGQVTCGFGGGHPEDVDARAGKCPDGTVFYAFASSAADATDPATYYGSERSTLMTSTLPPAAVVDSSQAEELSCA